MRDALEIQRKCGGCDADAAETLSSMGFVFAKNQEYAEAAAVLKEAVSLQRRVLSDAHPHTIVTRENLNHVLSLVQPGTVAYKVRLLSPPLFVTTLVRDSVSLTLVSLVCQTSLFILAWNHRLI